MFALSCASQNYAWGRIGEESIIAKLKAASDPSFTLEATKPYAELWMVREQIDCTSIFIPFEFPDCFLLPIP